MSASEYQKQYSREVYYWRRQNHICVRCGHEEAEPNKVQCSQCLDKKIIKNREYNEKNREKIREHNREHWRKKYQERKKNGICTQCGKRPIMKNSTYICVECRVKRFKRYHERTSVSGKIVRGEWPQYGMCYMCGKQELYSKKLCKDCFEKANGVLKKLHKNPTIAVLNARENFGNYNKIIFQKRRVNYG